MSDYRSASHQNSRPEKDKIVSSNAQELSREVVSEEQTGTTGSPKEPPSVENWVNRLQRTSGTGSQWTVFRSLQSTYGNQFATTVARSYHKSQATTGVIQRITHNGKDIDIDTLSVRECNEHVGRFNRLKNNKGKDNDNEYTYADTDLKKLKDRIEIAKGLELENRRKQVVADLENQLSTLATASDFTTPPEWNGSSPGKGKSDETFTSGSLKPDAVVARWREFLGPGPYSHKHPRDGSTDLTRLVSADGKRTIRYGDHEKQSDVTKHHFHEETWSYDSSSNTVNVDNKVRRVPIT
ncbi:MAG TPA: hypothetical protein VH186_26935 [Chloroflexia bacterium]|nr:hypothetical protein [Chloroflexia bacterium]